MISKIITIYSYLNKRQKLFLYLVISLMFVTTFFELIGIGMIIPLFSAILNTDPESNKFLGFFYELLGENDQKNFLIKVVFIMVSVFLIKSIIIVVTIFLQFSFAWNLQQHFRTILYSKYLKKNYEFFLKTSSSKIISQVIAQVDQFTNLFVVPIMFIILEFLIIFSITLFLVYFEAMGVLIFLSTLIVAILLYIFFGGKKLKNIGGEWKSHNEDITKYIQQSLEGIKETILYNRKNFFLDKIRFHSVGMAKPMKIYLTFQQMPRIILELFSVIALSIFILVIVIYSDNFNEGLLKIGVFAAAAFKILPSANRLLYSVQSLKYSKSILDDFVKQLEGTNTSKKNTQEKVLPLKFEQNIKIKNLSFTYLKEDESKNIFSDINFDIIRGDKIGIKGETGSGKSTFIDLLSGLLKPSSGFIYSDGVEINKNLNEWQKIISYVPQFSYFMEDTIRNNITFLEKNPDEKKLEDIINNCELKKFVDTLPKGLDSVIGERGIQISGGQKQRIAIARAIYREPNILILDESVSALDENTATKIVDKIIKKSDITIVFVSHNLDSLKFCNKIFRLENGNFIKEK